MIRPCGENKKAFRNGMPFFYHILLRSNSGASTLLKVVAKSSSARDFFGLSKKEENGYVPHLVLENTKKQ